MFNCSSTLHQTCIVVFVCCQFAHDVALTGGQRAPPAPRKLVRLTWLRDDVPSWVSRLVSRSIPHRETPAHWASRQGTLTLCTPIERGRRICQNVSARSTAVLFVFLLQRALQNFGPVTPACQSCGTPPIADLPELHTVRTLHTTHEEVSKVIRLIVPSSPLLRQMLGREYLWL